MSRRPMTAPISVYFRGVIAGALAVLASAVVVFVVAFIALIRLSGRAADNASYGWDPVAFARTPLAWTIVVLAFAAGFYWQYHRIIVH
jgi:hypothetical protein